MYEQIDKLLTQAEQLNERAYNARMDGKITSSEFQALMKMVDSLIDEAHELRKKGE
jgi:hypothetical protein